MVDCLKLKRKENILLYCHAVMHSLIKQTETFHSFLFLFSVTSSTEVEIALKPDLHHFSCPELECEFHLTKNIRELSSLNILDLANNFCYAEFRMMVCSLGFLLRYVQNIWINEDWINKVWMFTHTLKRLEKPILLKRKPEATKNLKQLNPCHGLKILKQ